MPRPVADSVVVISSSSSSEEEGEGRGGSTSRARHVHHSATASVGGEKGDGVRKIKKRKEENCSATIGEDRRVREESGPERRAKPKAPKKKQEKEKKAPLSPANAVEAVASGDEFAHPSIIFALLASPLKRPTAGGTGGGGNGGKNVDRVRKDKRKEREEGPSAVGRGDARREGEETKANTKRKKEEDKKKKKATPLRYSDVNGADADRPSAVYSPPTNPAIHLVAGAGGGKKTDGVKKKKKKRDVETSAIANGNVWGKGGERKSNVKKKDKNGEDTEDKGSSSSYAGDVVATSDEVGLPSPTCSFPMSRVKRLIAGSEDGVRKSGVRTSLDAVFLINKASEFFLELFAQDAYAHAAQEHKRALFYKHLSSTVCDEKRYEFLSDFVPEKVRVEDALKALAEQP